MFFKERFACYILFSYQCSFAVRDSFYILSFVAFFVNNFFQLFLIRFRSFKAGPLHSSFLLICCCRVQHPWILYALEPTKVNNIFQNIFKMAK